MGILFLKSPKGNCTLFQEREEEKSHIFTFDFIDRYREILEIFETLEYFFLPQI
jgi:hypothetical protein